MRDIYSVYMLFLVVVTLRYALATWRAWREGAPEIHHGPGRLDE